MVVFAQDITELRKTVEETNRTQAHQRTLTQEQIHGLVSTTTDLSQRVSSLERGRQAPAPGVSQGHWCTFFELELERVGLPWDALTSICVFRLGPTVFSLVSHCVVVIINNFVFFLDKGPRDSGRGDTQQRRSCCCLCSECTWCVLIHVHKNQMRYIYIYRKMFLFMFIYFFIITFYLLYLYFEVYIYFIPLHQRRAQPQQCQGSRRPVFLSSCPVSAPGEAQRPNAPRSSIFLLSAHFKVTLFPSLLLAYS